MSNAVEIAASASNARRGETRVPSAIVTMMALSPARWVDTDVDTDGRQRRNSRA
jgi:hypothetical protein